LKSILIPTTLPACFLGLPSPFHIYVGLPAHVSHHHRWAVAIDRPDIRGSIGATIFTMAFVYTDCTRANAQDLLFYHEATVRVRDSESVGVPIWHTRRVAYASFATPIPSLSK